MHTHRKKHFPISEFMTMMCSLLLTMSMKPHKEIIDMVSHVLGLFEWELYVARVRKAE